NTCERRLVREGGRLLARARARREHLAIFGDRTRSPDQIALHLVAALPREKGQLLLRLYALGKHRQPEHARERDDGAGYGGGLPVAARFRSVMSSEMPSR